MHFESNKMDTEFEKRLLKYQGGGTTSVQQSPQRSQTGGLSPLSSV
jgi:hypothetical protein